MAPETDCRRQPMQIRSVEPSGFPMDEAAASAPTVIPAWRRPCRQAARILGFVTVGAIAILSPSKAAAADALPRSLLILNQSTPLRPWPTAIIAGIQSSMQVEPVGTITYYVEHLDLYQLDSARYR